MGFGLDESQSFALQKIVDFSLGLLVLTTVNCPTWVLQADSPHDCTLGQPALALA